jgi:hypothetical protein
MAVWAYECRSCPPGQVWWVGRTRTDEVAHATNVLRVQVGSDWLCAIVDRSQAVAVDEQLVREAIASDRADCPECFPQPVAVAESAPEAATGEDSATPTVEAAAISLAGRRLVVILVPVDLVRSPGEAEMLLADLHPRFGGLELVLMGQDDDGTPRYHGDPDLLSLLAGVPVDRMPWKVYPLK